MKAAVYLLCCGRGTVPGVRASTAQRLMAESGKGRKRSYGDRKETAALSGSTIADDSDPFADIEDEEQLEKSS